MEKSYKQLCSEIESLKKQAEAARKQEIAKAVVEVRRLIKAHGLTLSDCGFGTEKSVLKVKQSHPEPIRKVKKASVKNRKPVPVKYRHPENAALTWTGRGKAPKWLAEEEANGKARQVFLV